MKVYVAHPYGESSNPNKRGFNKVPQTCLTGRQVKIKNSQLNQAGFKIGEEFTVIYQRGKILLQLNKGEKYYESG